MSAEVNHADRQSHWDDRYRTIGEASVSWYEAEPRLSLGLIDRVGATASTSVIDIGGGASAVTARLQQQGFDDLTVLDISTEALEGSKRRIERPDEVTWLHTDLLDWSPTRRWGVWHDRAVFHFLTEQLDRDRYREILRSVVEPGGAVIIATFAEDGPTTCSGLAVQRYSAERLLAELGTGFVEITNARTDHVTPSGGIQPFTWIAARVI